LEKELNSFQSEQFIKEIRKKHGVRIFYTDNTSFYHLAYKWARVENRIYGNKLKNLIERFIQIIKDRIEFFDDYFPCLKEECDYNRDCQLKATHDVIHFSETFSL
jgi:putative transposase